MARTRALNAMVASMRRFGQISPVLVTKEEHSFVLIDGYLRLQAVKILGMDVLDADIREEAEADMLAMVLSKSQERQWESVEQGFLIRDLTSRFSWSMVQVARRLERDPSWISRRLALVNDLPEEVLDALCKGHVCTWAAGRILAPLARANKDHALRLTSALVEQSMSSRDLNVVWRHYEKSNAKVRDHLVDHPHLFTKVHKAQVVKEQAASLARGPEGEWDKDLRIICCILRRLKRQAGVVLYGGEEQRKPHLHAMEQARELFHDLHSIAKEIIGGQARATHGGTGNAQGRDVDSRNRTQAEHLAQHGAQNILRGNAPETRQSPFLDHLTRIRELCRSSRGNLVRVQELLHDDGIRIGYTTLTRLVREHNLRDTPVKRAGFYEFLPGEEMQFDTSPHTITLDGRRGLAHCARLVLGYSRKLYVQYYPVFTRFEARAFLTKALAFMGGSCKRCVIDNTSVAVIAGSGETAVFAPEMEAFARHYGFTFTAHALRHADRKGKVERPFAYIEGNFLAAREFASWEDINTKALAWCLNTSNPKTKRVLGMSPDAAHIIELPFLVPPSGLHPAGL